MRWLTSWLLYLVGVVWDECLEWAFRDHGFGWGLFSVGQWLFCTSVRVQGKSGKGPWYEVKDEYIP